MLLKTIYYENDVQHIIIKIKYNSIIIGLLHGIIENNSCNINSLNVNGNYQNNGYGSIILHHLIEYCINNQIKYITLDDMSDRFNQKNNIYLKFGFTYIHYGFPEMKLNI